MRKSLTKLEKLKLCGFCGKTLDSESDNFCSKTCSRHNDITESIQNVNFCVGILKKELSSKSDKKTNDLIKILENNSFKISQDIIILRSRTF